MSNPVSFLRTQQGFKFANETANKSARTTVWYDKQVTTFREYLLSIGLASGVTALRLSDVTTDHVRGFVAYLQARTSRYDTHVRRKPSDGGLSPYTIRGYVRALSAFFAWSEREGLLARNPMTNVQWPKTPQSIKPVFSDDEIQRLVKACDAYSPALAARNRALIFLLLDTGVRAGELCGLTLDRLDEDYRRAHVTGKGMKDRFVVMGVETRNALWKYITVYRNPHQREAQEVFLTARGQPLDTETLGLILRRLGERAEVADCHPHKWRHTAATLFYKNSNGNLFLTQQMLGHQSPVTTRIYAKTFTADLERVHAQAGPVHALGLK